MHPSTLHRPSVRADGAVGCRGTRETNLANMDIEFRKQLYQADCGAADHRSPLDRQERRRKLEHVSLSWRSKTVAGSPGLFLPPTDAVARRLFARQTRPDSGRGSIGKRSMDKPTSAIGMLSLSDIGLDDLPVRVLCEIGRFDLSLGALRRLDVGTTLPLVRGADNAVDIVVSGKRIGRGALIKIGTNVGVRVTRLFDRS